MRTPVPKAHGDGLPRHCDPLQHGHGAVVVTVVAVGMVQAAVNQIVEVVAVRHERVTAALVAALTGDRGAGVGIRLADREHVLVVVALVGVVEVAVVEVVHMAIVLDAQVAAVGAVDVAVVGVGVVGHGRSFPRGRAVRGGTPIVHDNARHTSPNSLTQMRHDLV